MSSPPEEVIGLSLPAVAWRLVRRWRSVERHVVVVAPDAASGEALRRALAFFSGLDLTAIGLIAEPSSKAYTPLNPSVEWERDTAAALTRLAVGEPWSFLVVTARALARMVPRPGLFERSVLLLEEGMTLAREEIVAFLEGAGYGEADAAEQPGTYVVRGGIVEIFAPFYPDPIRVDLFGDTIDALHFFDADTLARKRPTTVVEIAPVTIFLVGPDGRERGAAAYATMAAAVECPPERVVEVQTAVFLEGRPPGYLNVLPLFVPGLASIKDFLPDDAEWVIVEHHQVQEELEAFTAGMAAAFEASAEAHEPASPPEALFALTDTPGAEAWPEGTRRFARVRSDPSCYEELTPDVRDMSELRAAVRKARKAREPEFVAVVDYGRRVLHDARHKLVFVIESGRRARHLKRALNAKGIKCEREPGPRDGRPVPKHALIRRGHLDEGFYDRDAGIAWVSEADLFEASVLDRKAPVPAWEKVHAYLSNFKPGDHVVHDAYGIGRYRGVVRKRVDGMESDFVQVDYRGEDRVLLPVMKVDRLQRYVAGQGVQALDKLGSNAFERRKERVRKALERIAQDLVDLYAQRSVSDGVAYPPAGELDDAFAEACGFELTPDQDTAHKEVMGDLQSPRPMDRLLCGDVGFGKTEIALRAAFAVVQTGRQVVVLVPTTVLAEQHRETFARRMDPFAARVASVTRFQTRKEQVAVLADMKAGKVDVLIGTHRLLQDDVKPANLGLLVIDEEHRFGVRHKDRIKALRARVDVLSMTATPIPRSLELSLSGIRDLSVIATPPEGRRAVRTIVTRFDAKAIREAILRELHRGGKIFFVHNRVRSIGRVRELLERLVPEARVVVGHGQMRPRELESVMVRFASGDADLLLSTTIVESGLDIPVANTIIINQAHRLGLSELYQLRGRVGRSTDQAWSYLLIPGERLLTPDARKRLRSMRKHTDLGSGFQLAMEDLEIRGAGNMLGEAQSGHVEAVGYSLYMSLLEEAVRAQRGQGRPAEVDATVRAPVPTYLPTDWFPGDEERLRLYKRLAAARSFDQVLAVEDELERRGDGLPQPVQDLLTASRIRVRAMVMGVCEVIIRPASVTVRFARDRTEEWAAAIAAIGAGELAFTPVGDGELRKSLPVVAEGRLLKAVLSALKPLRACVKPRS